MMGKPGEKVRRRIYYGPFRAWEKEATDDGAFDRKERSELNGRGHLNIMFRENLRVNVNIELYTKGSWPWFRRKGAAAREVTVHIPTWVVMDVAAELQKRIAAGELQVRRRESTCTKRRYKAR